MPEKLSILVIEDEAAIRTGLTDVLIFHGYDVESTGNGKAGLELAMTGRFDLILLDIMLPGMDGLEVCNAIRQVDRSQPIIMLTARVSDDDIIRGLQLGADDYVGKPFSVEQLVLRIAAVLRRSRAGERQASHIRLQAQDGNHEIDIDTQNLSGEIRTSGSSTAISFTRREMDILQYLNAHSDRPVPREELLARVWGYGKDLDIETRTVDIHIAKLRRKIEPDPKSPQYLTTIRGAGYRLSSDA